MAGTGCDGRSGRHCGAPLSFKVTAGLVGAVVALVSIGGYLQSHPATVRETADLTVSWRTTGERRVVTGTLIDPSGRLVGGRVVSLRINSDWVRADGPDATGAFRCEPGGLVVTAVEVRPGGLVEWPKYRCPSTAEGLHLTIRLKDVDLAANLARPAGGH